MNINQTLQHGLNLHKAGRLAEALPMYRQIVATDPTHSECHYLIATLMADTGNLNAAVEEYQHAIKFNPMLVAAHNDLGNVFRQLGNFPAAVECFKKVIQLAPAFPQAYLNLGNALSDSDRHDDAAQFFIHALKLKPDFAEAHNALGNLLLRQEKTDDAIHAFNRALQIKRDFPAAYCGLGGAFLQKRSFVESIANSRRALQLKPDLAEACNNLGNAYADLHQTALATSAYERALELKPDFPEALNNFAKLKILLRRPDEAIALLEKSVSLQPHFTDALGNLANALKETGQLDRAIELYRKCLEIKPGLIVERSALLLCLHYHPLITPQLLHQEARQWNEIHTASPAQDIQAFSNDVDPNRRLKIGYVSPDLRSHPVGRYILSLLAGHDSALFEIACYSNSSSPDDDITRSIQEHCVDWKNIRDLSDAQAAHLIRTDAIDILVDLALHTRDNRLLLFAKKPAPVQVTFAGYPGSTGLSAINYRLTDLQLDPPGLFDAFYSEESIRLPDTFWCDQFMPDEPSVNAPPATTNGFVTFGSLNNFCKLNENVLSLWARVLGSCENSLLLLLAPLGESRLRVQSFFKDRGIEPGRITFVSMQPRDTYLRTYHQIDIALDPFPYGGHSTSFDALWMGVPIVSLVGQTVVGRAGLSQLTNLGLTDLVAQTPDQYLQIAVHLANDLQQLTEIRRTLREKMRRSPLVDGTRFARGVETAYRSMWKRFCSASIQK